MLLGGETVGTGQGPVQDGAAVTWPGSDHLQLDVLCE